MFKLKIIGFMVYTEQLLIKLNYELEIYLMGMDDSDVDFDSVELRWANMLSEWKAYLV